MSSDRSAPPAAPLLSAGRRHLLQQLQRAHRPPQRPAAPGPDWVPVNPEGTRPPVLCVPPVSGSAYWSLALGPLLPRDRPVYALNAPGVGGGVPCTSIGELAAAFLRLAREHSVTAPGCLVGYSMGGIVAYEMAVQLATAGVRVPLVVMIDSDPPGPGPVSDEAEILRTFVRDLTLTLQVPPVDVPVADLIGARDPQEAMTGLHAALRDAGVIVPGIDKHFVWRRFQVFRAHMRALQRYAPASYRGSVAFLGAAGSERAAAAWRSRIDGTVDFYPVPGDHYSMWSPAHRGAVGAAVGAAVARLSPP